MNKPCSDEALKSGHGAYSEGNGIFQTKQAGWDSDEGCSESWQGYEEACTSWMGGHGWTAASHSKAQHKDLFAINFTGF